MDFSIRNFVELAIFLFITGNFILDGAEIQTKLMFHRACINELKFNQTVCNDLENFSGVKSQVQKYVNRFEEKSQWLGQVPSLIYSLIVGSLSDTFYRTKPFIIMPIAAHVIQAFILYINVFFETADFAFFYFERFWAFFGGLSVYDLGFYSYGVHSCDENDDKQRTTRLARMDGVEQIAMVLGSFLSGYIYEWAGYPASFGIRIITDILAVCFVVFVIHEPPKIIMRRKNKNGRTSQITNNAKFGVIFRFLVKPLVDMVKCIFKNRRHRKWLILQLICHALYTVAMQELFLRYFYLTLVFNDVTSKAYGAFNSISSIIDGSALLFVMPLITTYLKPNLALLLCFVDVSVAAGMFFQAISKNFWPQFYLAKIGLTFMYRTVYSVNRSLCINFITNNYDFDPKKMEQEKEEEVGKILSAFAVISCIIPLIANPIYRRLYSATVTNCPNAIYFFTSVILFIIAILHLITYVYTKNEPLKKGGRVDIIGKTNKNLIQYY